MSKPPIVTPDTIRTSLKTLLAAAWEIKRSYESVDDADADHATQCLIDALEDHDLVASLIETMRSLDTYEKAIAECKSDYDECVAEWKADYQRSVL